MALEIGLWKADGEKLTRLAPTAVGLESQLETYIESDPTIMGTQLMLIGRQVLTAHGGSSTSWRSTQTAPSTFLN